MSDYLKLKSIIEGLLFMAGEDGLTKRQLADILEVQPAVAADLVTDLTRDLQRAERGIQIVEVASAYRLTTRAEHAPYYERMAYSPTRSHLSQAGLETLAIIAYRQPITRIEIEEIRGVKTDRALQSLVGKDLIEEVGRAEAIGRPILYGTTKAFLDYFGLSTLSALPDPGELEGEEDELDSRTQMLFNHMNDVQLSLEDVTE